MAVIPAANISNISRATSNFKGSQLNLGELPVEVFRINAGAAADTAVLTPSNIKNITSVIGPVNHNIPLVQTAPATSVTVTLIGAAAAATPVDVYVVGAVNMSN